MGSTANAEQHQLASSAHSYLQVIPPARADCQRIVIASSPGAL